LRILDLLAVQAKLPRLVEQLATVPVAQVERELAALERLGLIFHEGDLYLSLILEPLAAAADLGRAAALAAEQGAAAARHLAVGG
ncbi:MAG TPA: hypothetical protein VJA16_23145, partial [Thermoanaerobaculia bacterium]